MDISMKDIGEKLNGIEYEKFKSIIDVYNSITSIELSNCLMEKKNDLNCLINKCQEEFALLNKVEGLMQKEIEEDGG